MRDNGYLFREVNMVCWKSEFEYGIPMIDDQHEKMIETCGQLFNVVYGAKIKAITEDVIQLVKEIRSCSKIHFETEALLFNTIPELGHSSALLEDQNVFLQSIDNYMKQIYSFETDDYEKIEQLKVLMSFVLNWLIKHVVVTDKKYMPYLKSNGNGRRISVTC